MKRLSFHSAGTSFDFYATMKVGIFLFLSLHLLSPVPSSAQTSTVQQTLNFNPVFPGMSKTIHPGDAGSAKFSISGTSGSEVQITFELPSDLINDSGNNIPITFNLGAAGYNRINESHSAFIFDPDTELITTLNKKGTLYIWLGGTIHPKLSQPRGSYSTDISLHVSYTSN